MIKKLKKDNLDNQEIKKLKSQIKELKAKIEIFEQGWKRTQADFENYCKRNEEQKFELIELAKAGFMSKLTPALDNFRRAFENIPKKISKTDWANGVKQIEKQLMTILKEEGLKKIETKGETFNPCLHEAISYEKNADVPANHIIDEYESGWVFNGKVIKCAKVRVSRGSQNE